MTATMSARVPGSLNVFRLEDRKLLPLVPPSDRYAIVLINENTNFWHTVRKGKCKERKLLFFNMQLGSVAKMPTGTKGFFSSFSLSFFPGILHERLGGLSMFAKNGESSFFLSEELNRQAIHIFTNMMKETTSSYLYKDDLLRVYIVQLIHLAVKSSFYLARG